MDWITDNFAFAPDELQHAFHYGTGTSVLLRRRMDGRGELSSQTMSTDGEWEKTLEALSATIDNLQMEVIVLLLGREDDRGPPKAVNHVPLSQSVFEKMVSTLRVHRSIMRPIARKSSTFWFAQLGTDIDPVYVANFRTPATYANDLAMSLTHFPHRGVTVAVVYGCGSSLQADLKARMARAPDEALYHPLLLPGMLAEFERSRLCDLVDECAQTLVVREEEAVAAFTVQSGAKAGSSPSVRHGEVVSNDLTKYYYVKFLSGHVKAMKQQVVKLSKACDEISSVKQDHKAAGTKVSKRAMEIADDLEVRINKCDAIAGNISMASQTDWNRYASEGAKATYQLTELSTELTLRAMQDNQQMKAIAFLTMIILPLSASATFFSMSMFNFRPAEGKLVSDWIWLYCVVAFGSMGVTVFLWWFLTLRQRVGQMNLDRVSELIEGEKGADNG